MIAQTEFLQAKGIYQLHIVLSLKLVPTKGTRPPKAVRRNAVAVTILTLLTKLIPHLNPIWNLPRRSRSQNVLVIRRRWETIFFVLTRLDVFMRNGVFSIVPWGGIWRFSNLQNGFRNLTVKWFIDDEIVFNKANLKHLVSINILFSKFKMEVLSLTCNIW